MARRCATDLDLATRIALALVALSAAGAPLGGCSGFRRGPYEGDAGGCGAGPGVCNVITNAGCASGQVCALSQHVDGGATSLCALPGALPFGAACASPDECVAGLHCVDGQCRRLCCGGSDDQCRAGPGVPPTARCVLDLSADGYPVMACATPCDWRAQDCPGSLTCLALTESGETDCVVSGTQSAATRCESTADCNRTLACVEQTATTAYCRHICDPTAPVCSAATTCVQAAMAPPTFGFCVPP